ncbi:MAG: hypothetical protein JXA00_03545 [Candidatus Thermoplasmatota archaeon]|nr:hypothetical protein [Candidatus Thermoplasmatota archaeon]
MRWPAKGQWFFIVLSVLAVVVLLVSVYDILYNEEWLTWVGAFYGVLLLLVVVMLYLRLTEQPAKKTAVAEFEKTLKGALHHFKCPSCGGVFAVKKSRQDNKKSFLLTCPDCGMTGMVPSTPSVIVAEIPEKKSTSKNFTCQQCGEWVMVWAEGTELASDLHVYSCPYCGAQQDLQST